MKYITNSNIETFELGKKIGESLKGGEVLLLDGDLGAGKTQFTKGIAKGLGVDEEVISPTFTIERIYNGQKYVLHHFDFYRLHTDDPELVEEVLDLATDTKNIIVIEWPQNLEKALPEFAEKIYFKYLEDEKREIEFNFNKYLYLSEVL